MFCSNCSIRSVKWSAIDRVVCLAAIMAALPGGMVRAASADVAALLQHPIIDAGLPLKEVQDFCEARVPVMPKVNSAGEWQRIAEQMRRDVLDKIVFRGEAAKQWREAKTKVEWFDVIDGGPGYRIKKLRFEALPGLWIPALLYEPDGLTGKIPVHLAVNGHGAEGKALKDKQTRCINLAKRGVASLNVEWLYMGQLRGDGFAHYRMNQLDLCGVSGLAPFYLNMSRALDILLGLPYADPKRVAMSGLSGGGWQTIFLSALDPRITLANPVAGYSSLLTRARHPTDLGDSEQTPNDLATIADYAHFTAMLAGRSALLTFNAKDNCCFASGHALQPLLEAAQPIFGLHGQSHRLRSHVNYDPGTHNDEVDNRQAFYAVMGAEFFPGDTTYSSTELAAENELKTAQQLDVPLPENLDFHKLATQLSQGLPREPERVLANADEARRLLAQIVKFKEHAVVPEQVGSETRGDVQATFWKLRFDNVWTVPAVELRRGEVKGTTVVVADAGRAAAAADIEALLAGGQRVIAMDPFYFGESKISTKDSLHALLVSAVGDRPLGIQASEVAAAARWAKKAFGDAAVSLQAMGPRSSTFALAAAALEPSGIGKVKLVQPLQSLHQVIDENWQVSEKPELFCFGLLEAFDVPQLKQLVGEERLSD